MSVALTRIFRSIIPAVLVLTLAGPALWAADPDALLNDLESGTAEQKCRAADQICHCEAPPAKFADALRAGIQDKDANVRWHCARSMGLLELDDAASRQMLRSALQDGSPAVCIQSARALARIGDASPETVAALVQMAANADGRKARAAIQALRETQADHKQVVEAISDVLDHDEHAVAMHAVEALVERGAAAVPFLTEALGNPKSAYWACIAIEEIGPAAAETAPRIAGLLTARDSDSQLRVQALLALAALGESATATCPQVVAVLSESADPAVHSAAAYALGAIGCPGGLETLKKTAQAEDPLLSMVSLWALASLQPDNAAELDRAVKALTVGLGNDDPRIRTVAAKGLHKLNPAPEIAAPALIAVASDPDPSVVANVIDALASLGAGVAGHAANALDNKDLRDVAVAVIARLGEEGAAAVPALIAAYEPDDPAFTAQLQLALAEIGAAASPATDHLARALTASDERLRHSAIYALGRIGPPANRATAALRTVMGSDDPFERTAAAWALVRIMPGDKALAAAARPHLVAGLANEQAEVRLESALALGAMGAIAKDALGPLERVAAEDASDEVRAAARDAIQAIQSAG